MRLALLLLLLGQLALLAEERTWTDIDGREIKASLVRVEGDKFVIRLKGKTYTWPAAKFSAPDQDYATDWKVKQEASRKERLSKLVGAFPNSPLTTRAYPKPADYLDGHVFQGYLERTPPDYRKQNLDALDYAIAEQSAALFVPPNYDESQAFGVYVFVNAGNGTRLPSADYRNLFEKYRLIYITANRSGNKEVMSRRLELALDSLATVNAAYRIDPKRCYVGGVSGGGIMSTMINFLRPEHFRAAINIVRGALLEPYVMRKAVTYGGGAYEAGSKFNPFIPRLENKHGKLSKAYGDKRWVFISGDQDFNYEFSQASGPQWSKHGYRAKSFDVPGMGHTNAPVATFEEALHWIESKSGP